MAIWADRIGPRRLGGDLGRHPEPHLDLSNEFTRWMAKDPPMKGRQNRSTKGELGSIVRKGAGFDRGKGSSKGGWYRYQAGNMASDKAKGHRFHTLQCLPAHKGASAQATEERDARALLANPQSCGLHEAGKVQGRKGSP
eukprot:scaffold574_cov333-Pavlova_lutheri.AAC.16